MKTVHTPITFKIGIAAFPLAILFLVIGVWQNGSSYMTPLFFLSAAFALFSIGELLNHPRQVDCNFTENEESSLKRVHHRHRNPCALGNLFCFTGLLFLFVALGHVISF